MFMQVAHIDKYFQNFNDDKKDKKGFIFKR